MHFSVSAGRQYQSFSCSLSLSLTFFVWPKPYTESLTGKGGCVMTVYIDSLFLLDLVVHHPFAYQVLLKVSNNNDQLKV